MSEEAAYRLAVPAPPPDDARIWRYMDFTRFVSLLESRALFFSRVSDLDDPFEGSFPKGQTILDRVLGMLPNSVTQGAQINLSEGLQKAWPAMRKWALVSCWHISEYESAAMWKLYGAKDAAVAIQSTVGDLRTALGKPPSLSADWHGSAEFHIGSIEYLDYSTGRIPTGSFASQYFRKRQSFDHERELRALFMRYPLKEGAFDFGAQPDSNGLPVPVDLSRLIRGVRIAPQAPKWYADLVQAVQARYRVEPQPVQSELDAPPLY